MVMIQLAMRLEEELALTCDMIEDMDWPVPTTAGDLLNITVACLRAEQRSFSEDVVWETVRRVVVEVLHVHPDSVTREARLRDDLGAE
jgi:acyl carrier protein